METDETDKKILNVLMENSRLSYRQIAKKLKLSTATIMKRVNRMEKEKIIKKYTAEIDYDKLGYDIPVIIELRILKGKLFEMEKRIAKNPNVSIVYDTTGELDATLIARFKTRKAMDSFLKEIQTYDFIQRTNTKLILNTIKEEYIKL
jgi:Lrp/AsnC family transcriptional regulator, regulator for asnA, asnC and gidA